MDNKRYGEAPLPDQAYDDLEGVDCVLGLPDTAFHRDVDKIVLAAAADDPDAVKVAIVCPPTVYGRGKGPINRRSRQIPGLIKATLEKGTGFKLGAGKTEWDNVHVHDLSGLIDLLASDAASKDSKSAEKEIWGPRGYHFCENGTHLWSHMSELITEEAYNKGYLKKNEVKQIDDKEAMEINGFEALSWGLNSKSKAKRARKYLGWEPKHPSLPDSIPELVQCEAEKLGLSKK
jgi:nucleoside-diphosphate-sugar epimerase